MSKIEDYRLRKNRDDAEDSPILSDSERATPRKKVSIKLKVNALDFSILLNISFTILLVLAFWFRSTQCLHAGRLMDACLYSPASDVIEYVPHVFKMAFRDDQSPYQGWPDAQKDELWQDMYSRGMAIRIDQQSAGRLINRTEHAPVAGLENDYVVGLDVFHQLHCLNMIRQSIYPRRYDSSIIREDGSIDFLAWSHLDHCIEALRESLTCSADISAIPYRWHPETKIAEPDIRTVHMCRNFTKIRNWAFERFIPMTSKRRHVENGVVVDYSGAGIDPEEALAEELANPNSWDKTVNDFVIEKPETV